MRHSTPAWLRLATRRSGSNYLAANSVAAVDASAIAMLVSAPVFAMSRDAAMHMEDTAPLQLASGTQGSAVVASPMLSGFQTDTIAIRSRLSASWVRRRSGCTAIVPGALW